MLIAECSDRKPLFADQRDEAAAFERGHGETAIGLLSHQLKNLIVSVAHRNDETSSRCKLFDQRRWNSGSGSRDDDGIVERMLGKPKRAIARNDSDIAIPETVQRRSR